MTDADRLTELLAARPGRAAWQEICRLLQDCDTDTLADLTPRVLRWPAAERPMPDAWWAQWTAGDERPYHALAGTRFLGRLDSVETGTVAEPIEEDWSDDESGESGAPLAAGGDASFYHGAAAVGAPASLRWLALGARAAWHRRGGDIVRWDTTRDAPLVWYLDGADSHDEAYDVQVSPDGAVVVAAVEGSWHAWCARTGRTLWRLSPRETGSADPAGDGSMSVDDLVRFAFSADSARVAVGTESSDVVAVLDARTGAMPLRVPEGQDAFGPVALDATGALVAHAGPGGRVVVRDVATGEVLGDADTGLTSVNALALAPDGGTLFAVGGAVGGTPQDAGLATHARPAARLLTLDATGRPALTPGALIRPADCPPGIDAGSQLAAMTSRAAWTATGPCAFVGADFGSVLFNGRGQTLWADPAGASAGFTPDGRALVAVQEEVGVWFLDGMALPDDAPAPAEPAPPGEVLLTGLPVPGADGGAEAPCSYWPVRLAAVTDDARALVFSAKLDRVSVDRAQVLCRWPADGGGPDISLLPVGAEDATFLADLAVSPRGGTIARAMLADGVQLLASDLRTGAIRWRYTLPPSRQPGADHPRLAFSADGDRLALATADGQLAVLDTALGKPVGEHTAPGAPVHAVALDAPGRRLAFAGPQGVTVQDAASGRVLLITEAKELRQVTGLAFAPDGGELAVAGSTHCQDAALWTISVDTPAPAPAPRVAVHDLPMNDRPDGRLVWSGTGPRACFLGSAGAGALWDAATGRVVADLPFGADEGAIALSPDGRTFVTVTQSGARRWRLG